MSNYLLREREFINSNQNIFKFGKTEQEQLKRMGGYPKGSELLIHYKCRYISCSDMEKKIKEDFLKKFRQRTDIGLEYFEGDPDDIRNTFMDVVRDGDVKGVEEKEEKPESDTEEGDYEQEETDSEIEEEKEIETVEELLKSCGWDDIIIINRKTKKGILRPTGGNIWYEFKDSSEEDLKGWINENVNDNVNTQYIIEKILKERLKKNIKIYEPEYSFAPVCNNQDIHILDLEKRTFTKLENTQYYVWKREGCLGPLRNFFSIQDGRVKLVDDLIKSYIPDNYDFRQDFKNLCKGVFVGRNKMYLNDVAYSLNIPRIYPLTWWIKWAVVMVHGEGSYIEITKENKVIPKKGREKIRLIVLWDNIRKNYVLKQNLPCPIIEFSRKKNIYDPKGLYDCIQKNIEFFPDYKDKNPLLYNDIEDIFERQHYLLLDMLLWSCT